MLLGVRTLAVAVAGLGLAGGVGCHSDGNYNLTWTFAGDPMQMTSALTCAQNGVFALRITGASLQGDGDEVEVPCAPGAFTQSVGVGTWSFTVHGLDGSGHYRGDQFAAAIDTDASSDGDDAADAETANTAIDFLEATLGPIEIVKDGTAVATVQLIPRPTCADGVDNNADGRVDLDDPLCQGNPYGSEGPAAGGSP